MYGSRDTPTPELAGLIEEAFKQKPVKWKKPHAGLTVAQRFVCTLEDGSSFFVKAAMDDETERLLRVDHRVMSTVRDDFVPRVLDWLEPAGQRPVLVIEDMGRAHWPADHDPVLWKEGQFDILFATLERVAATPVPEGLPAAENPTGSHWEDLAGDPGDFLALGLCSSAWFEEAVPALVEAERRVVLEGDALVHDDVRSDNLCFFEERMVLVDWSQAMRGSPLHDLSFILPCLRLEGGPPPQQVMPANGEWAAYRSGAFALRAARERAAPAWLNRVFRRLTAISLEWATAALELPPWEGKGWREI